MDVWRCRSRILSNPAEGVPSHRISALSVRLSTPTPAGGRNATRVGICLLGPNQNAYVESFNGRLRDECLDALWGSRRDVWTIFKRNL
jgi:hypothetical protein